MADVCKGCGARLFWTRHASTDRAHPLDELPSPRGNLRVWRDEVRGYVFRHATADDAPGVRYLSHFATCPKAGDFRRGGDDAEA